MDNLAKMWNCISFENVVLFLLYLYCGGGRGGKKCLYFSIEIKKID